MMEMAKVTSKGQITIPISIRRRLGINEGDKILFINKYDGVLMVNPDTVQGDISDYANEAVPLEAVTAAQRPAAAAAPVAAPAARQARTAAPQPAAPQSATADTPAATISEPVAAAPAAAVSQPIEPPKRKYIPPVEDDNLDEPAVKAGGIDLSTLLDDLRTIGSV